MSHVRAFVLSLGIFAMSVAYATARWGMEPKDSTVSFEGTQAGAPFTGKFHKFTADIHFDPAALAQSQFDVKIDLGSVDTGDQERDGIIKGPDLFAVEQWPVARYVVKRFTTTGEGRFTGLGQLTLRNVTREVPIQFTFKNKGTSAWLKGSATLKRLDFGVGQGEWRDTEAVADEVKIRFTLRLQQ